MLTGQLRWRTEAFFPALRHFEYLRLPAGRRATHRQTAPVVLCRGFDFHPGDGGGGIELFPDNPTPFLYLAIGRGTPCSGSRPAPFWDATAGLRTLPTARHFEARLIDSGASRRALPPLSSFCIVSWLPFREDLAWPPYLPSPDVPGVSLASLVVKKKKKVKARTFNLNLTH